ncbi:MAG: discoidin domain-containing protein [Bacteroidaceae bacterium]|nr:discoidin domain-containing protein [Bacteroidaceae bacterium]
MRKITSLLTLLLLFVIGAQAQQTVDGTHVYTVSTSNRGSWVVPEGGTAITSTTNAGLAVDATDTKQQFAFVTVDGTQYLYSVSAKRFVSKSGNYTTLGVSGDPVSIIASSGNDSYPSVIVLNGSNQLGVSNGYNPAVISFWNSITDDGNRVNIAAVEGVTFDDAEAIQIYNSGQIYNAAATTLADNIWSIQDLYGVREVSAITSNSSDSEEGNLAALIDNNYATYHHSDWRGAVNDVHTITFELTDATDAIRFYIKQRSTGTGRPLNVTVAGSNDGSNFTDITTLDLTWAGSPADTYSDAVSASENYKYYRFAVNSTNSGTYPTNKWFCASEWYVLPNNATVDEFFAAASTLRSAAPEDMATAAAAVDAAKATLDADVAAHVKYTVTYRVLDSETSAVLDRSQEEVYGGTTVNTFPEALYRRPFYTYTEMTATEINANTNVDIIATLKAQDEWPVIYTEDATSPYYYNLKIRSKYLVRAEDNTVPNQDSSEPFNPAAAWAFIGNPYDGFSVINQAAGDGLYLMYSNLYNYDIRSELSDVNIVTLNSDETHKWLIDTNTGGFVLRAKDDTSVYLHQRNLNGLSTCAVSEWSAVHDDAGSTVVASTDTEVLVALYNQMKDLVYGDAIGQYYSTNDEISNEDANGTIASVGAAIAANQTAAYAEAYAALVELASATDLHTPAAGFYRVKNVATGKYLNAKAVKSYSQEAGVFADATDATSAATVIELREGADGIYMYTQSYGFGWVDAQKAVGNGNVWLTASPDKYVNWLPSTAAGQIAFSIALGNGTGSYANYLLRGIFTANENEEVVGGEDYTADAAQWIFEEAADVTLALNPANDDKGNAANYATTYLPFGVTLPAGVTAYTAEINEEQTRISLTELGQSVPAGTAVILKSETETEAVATIAGVTVEAGTNNLSGTYFSKELGEDELALGKKDGVVGFYNISNALNANRAYITVSSGIRALLFGDDELTGIESVAAGNATGNAAAYDLQGRRVSTLQKGGVYIIGGKKVVK